MMLFLRLHKERTAVHSIARGNSKPVISSFEAFGTTFTIIFTPLEVGSIVFTLHHRMFFYFLSNDDNVVQTDALHRESLEQVLAPHYFDQV